jgi:hypothetical protein
MPIFTRARARIEANKRREANTPKKYRFYDAWDGRKEGEGLRVTNPTLGLNQA